MILFQKGAFLITAFSLKEMSSKLGLPLKDVERLASGEIEALGEYTLFNLVEND